MRYKLEIKDDHRRLVDIGDDFTGVRGTFTVQMLDYGVESHQAIFSTYANYSDDLSTTESSELVQITLSENSNIQSILIFLDLLKKMFKNDLNPPTGFDDFSISNLESLECSLKQTIIDRFSRS
jgi:hypothetical protein